MRLIGEIMQIYSSHLHRNELSHRRVEPRRHHLCHPSNKAMAQLGPNTCPFCCSSLDCSIFHTAMGTFVLSCAINENRLSSIGESHNPFLFASLNMTSCNGSDTHGPGLQLGPKKLADALILDSVIDKSSSQPRATNVDSKY